MSTYSILIVSQYIGDGVIFIFYLGSHVVKET